MCCSMQAAVLEHQRAMLLREQDELDRAVSHFHQ